MLAPMDGHPDRVHYDALRTHGTQIPSNQLLSVGENFGMHPMATGLHELYQQNDLAIVRAIGLPAYELNFSHFEAQRYAELGTPGIRHTNSGWLSRHWQSATNYPNNIPLPIVVLEDNITHSLLNEAQAITMKSPSIFHLEALNIHNFRTVQEQVLGEIYANGNYEIDNLGDQALSAMKVVNKVNFNIPPDNDVEYLHTTNANSFGSKMKKIAQLIKQETGVRIAQADLDGWDTHGTQVAEFPTNVSTLSKTLKSFLLDLEVEAPGGGTWADRTTIMVYSEFGRRIPDNAVGGTDHGWAGTSLVLGAGVNGGEMYGQWPGLAPNEQYLNSLRGTVDYRTLMSEILIKRMGNNKIGEIFPGFPENEYNPLGVVSGANLTPDFNSSTG